MKSQERYYTEQHIPLFSRLVICGVVETFMELWVADLPRITRSSHTYCMTICLCVRTWMSIRASQFVPVSGGCAASALADAPCPPQSDGLGVWSNALFGVGIVSGSLENKKHTTHFGVMHPSIRPPA